MATLEYRGYIATVDYIAEDSLIVGEVVNTRDVIGFHAENAADVEQAFHDTIDSYIGACERQGQAPEKPYSGKLLVRMGADLHGRVAAMAAAAGASINQVVVAAIEEKLAAGLREGDVVRVVTAPSSLGLEKIRGYEDSRVDA